MTTRRPLRLLIALVAVLALAGAACSDDGGDGDATTTSTTTAPTSDDAAPATSDDGDEGDDDDTTTTEPDDDDTGTTDAVPGDLSLAARLPAIDGYDREIDDDQDDDGESLTDSHCDGTVPTLQPVEEASADYESDDGNVEELVAIAAVRFSTEDEASSAYDEFVAATSGCETDDSLTVDEGAATDIGDEGMSWALTFGGQAGGSLYATRVGDELWFLTVFGANGSIGDGIIDAYAGAAEG